MAAPHDPASVENVSGVFLRRSCAGRGQSTSASLQRGQATAAELVGGFAVSLVLPKGGPF